jgi:hypothetical protein
LLFTRREGALSKVSSMDAYSAEFSSILQCASLDTNDSFPTVTVQVSAGSEGGELGAEQSNVPPGEECRESGRGEMRDAYTLPDDIESRIGAIEECLQAAVLLMGCALR